MSVGQERLHELETAPSALSHEAAIVGEMIVLEVHAPTSATNFNQFVWVKAHRFTFNFFFKHSGQKLPQ
jgi:hypothetical protein